MTLIALTAVAVLASLLTAPDARAQEPATLTLTKTTSTTTSPPNTPFTFTLHYSCSSLVTTCDNVEITDVLPPQLSHAAADVSLVGDAHTVSTNYDPATGTATFVLTNPLPAGTTGAVSIAVKFPANITPVGATATNTATITASDAGTVTSNPVTVDAVVTPGIRATKGPAGTTIVAGVPFQYSISFVNSGNVNLQNGSLVDPLPAGLTCADVSQISSPGTCDPATNTLTWILLTNPVTPGTTLPHTFTVTYPATAAGTTVTNTVTASGTPLGETAPISNSASVTNPVVAPAPAVVVAKIAAPSGSVPLGTPITYTVSIRNSGNVPLTSVSMDDILPAGATFLNCTASNAGTCANSAGTVTWNFTATLAVGGTFTGTMVVRYDSPPNTAGETVTNTVNGRGTPSTGGAPVTGTASVNTTLTEPTGSGTVTKSLTSPATQFVVDTPVTYTVSTRNTSATTWTTVVVTDTLPTSPTTGAPPTSVSCTPAANCIVSGGTVTWTFNSVAPATTVTGTVTLTYQFPDFQPNEAVTNCASALAVANGENVPVPQSCSTKTLLPAVPGANITKSDTKSTVVVGSFDTYTLTYHNTGTQPLSSYTVTDLIPTNLQPYQTPATNVTFTDTRPGNLGPTDVLQYRDPTTNTFVPLTTTCANNTCTAKVPTTNTDQIQLIYSGTVPLGFTGTMTLVLQVPPSAVARSGVEILNGSTITNCGTVTATELTPEASPQSCTTQTVSEPVPTETLTKSRTSPSPVPPPSPVNWSLVYGTPATSPVPNLNPVVTDCLPVGLDLVDPANPGDPANGSPPANFTPAPSITRVVGASPCAANQVAVIWSWTGSVPALSVAPGTSGTFTLNTVLQPGTPPGTLTNSASAVEDNNATPTPNATATVVVASGASLDSIKLIKGSLDSDYSKYPNIGHTTFGGSADYRMEITNTGNIPIDNITAIDILPFVGDTAVLNASAPRDSQWSPELTGPVTAPNGVTVLYSTSTNPCRPELNYNPPGCVSGSFSATPPSDFSTVRSLEFQYTGPLAPGASLQIDWPMVAPANVIPGEVAWNSFAYTGFRADNNDQLTPAEPNKVGIQIEPYPLQIQKLVNNEAEPVAPGLHLTTGTPVTYTYLVTNPGDLTVTNLDLFDSPAQNITCDVGGVPTPPADASIAPHSTLTCTADAGPAQVGAHSDTACVTGEPIVAGTPGTSTTQVCDTANYFGATPSITLVKEINLQHQPNAPGPFIPVGSPVTFTYVIQNTGNVTLDPVVLTDDVLGTITCPLTSLAPGASMTCTVIRPAVAGQQINTAEVSGQPVDNNDVPFGSPVTADDVGNYFGVAPAISLIKNVNGQHEPLPPGLDLTIGSAVTYTYVVTNTGNVTLDSISLVDNVLGDITLDCPATSLAPNDTMTCTASGGTAAIGPHPNTATVTGQGVDDNGAPVGGPVTSSDTGNYLGVRATPSIVTTPSPGGPVGTPISDSATVHGGVNPTGFVTFELFGPGNTTCTPGDGEPVFTSTNPLTAGTATSGTFTAHATGTFRWVATYNGDANNNPVSSGCDEEQVSETQASPTIETFTSGGGPLGTSIFDNATLSGGENPTGTITFRLFGPNDTTCSLTPAFVSTITIPVLTRSIQSGSFTPRTVGTYRWVATYNGDVNNAAVSSGCADEPVDIGPSQSDVITTVPSPGGPVGTRISDTATVSGGVDPTGDVTFELFGPGDIHCATDLVANIPGFQNVPLTKLQATSPTVVTTAVGTYSWIAVYSGDAQNAPAHTSCDEEQVDTVQATPTIATTQSPTSGPVGTEISDTATVSGGFNPGGTVTFELFGPGNTNCTPGDGQPVFTSTNPLSGGTATSGSFPTTAPGTYQWVAIYDGDANNAPDTSGCQAEPVTISRTTVTIETSPSAGGVVGTSISDTATVSGGFNPTGRVAFLLFGPGNTDCRGAAVFVQIAPLTATGASSGSFPTTAAGTYRWVAVYLGDTNNAPAISGCQAEPVTITQAAPTIATTPSPGGVVGTALSDLATLSGAFNPTGTVTFKLFPPSDPTCAGNPVFTSTAPLHGIGALSGSFPTTAVGTYRWIATYNGDGNNAGVSSGCQDEPVNMSQAAPMVITTPSAGGPVGTAITDHAVVDAGVDPTGTVSFALYGPGDTGCTTDLVAGAPEFKNIPLAAARATSPAFTATVPGTYQWVVSYSGDANNQPAGAGCGDPSEQVHITAGPGLTAPPPVPGLPSTGYGGGGPALFLVPGVAGLAGLLVLVRRRRGRRGSR